MATSIQSTHVSSGPFTSGATSSVTDLSVVVATADSTADFYE